MENRFAGAQNQGERRRRRLSGDDAVMELDDHQPVADVSVAEHNASSLFADSILRRVVSPRLWKSVVAIAATVLVSTGMIWWAPQQTRFSLSGFGENLTDRFAGLLLIAAGQLAVLIGWIRSLSEVDFKGRYRSWKWLGLTASVSGVVLVLGVSELLPDLLTSLVQPFTGQIQAARPAIQLLFGATVSLIVLARIMPDMGRSMWSQGFLVVAILLAVVNVMLYHGAHANVGDQTFKALTLLSANAVFASMILHCRFVAFINNDPPTISSTNHGDSAAADVAFDDAETPADVFAVTAAEEPRITEEPIEEPASPRKRKSKQTKRKAA